MSQNDSPPEIREGEQAELEYTVSQGGQVHTAKVEGELVFVGNKLVRIRTEEGRTVEIAREDITGVSRPGGDYGDDEGEEESEEGEGEEGEEGEGEEEEGEFEMPFVEGCCDEEEEGEYGVPPEEEEELEDGEE